MLPWLDGKFLNLWSLIFIPPSSTAAAPLRSPSVHGVDSPASAVGHLIVCLHVLFFSYLTINHPWLYKALTMEDYWVENTTAGLFLLTGLLLFATAWAEKGVFHRCLYILGGLVMVFVAGEEISWGQRLIGFATPDALMDINAQEEFNLHNIDINLFYLIQLYGSLGLCVAACAAYFARKTALFRIPLPSIWIALGSLVLLSWTWDPRIGEGEAYPVFRDRHFLLPILSIALLIIFICSLFRRQGKLVVDTVVTVATVLTSLYVNAHQPIIQEGVNETREYLLGLLCLFYSWELFSVQPRRGAGSRTAFPVLNLRDVRTSHLAWHGAAALIVAAGIALALWQHFLIRTDAALIDDGREPIIRSRFDVYSSERRLVFVKQACRSEDIGRLIFLQIAGTGERGANLYFAVPRARLTDDGRCIVGLNLPYDITRIRTGWHTPERGIWNKWFLFDVADLSSSYQQATAGEPIVSSHFDVYRHEDRLIYLKEQCTETDTEPPFFLHLIPVDKADLPDHRRQYDFDNMDFHFGPYGSVDDGRCVATRRLPSYAIAAIRTGQFTAEGQLWKGEHRFGVADVTP